MTTGILNLAIPCEYSGGDWNIQQTSTTFYRLAGTIRWQYPNHIDEECERLLIKALGTTENEKV